MLVFCCQGDQGPVGPPGRPGDNGDPVSMTCTSTVVASNCKHTLREKDAKLSLGWYPKVQMLEGACLYLISPKLYILLT